MVEKCNLGPWKVKIINIEIINVWVMYCSEIVGYRSCVCSLGGARVMEKARVCVWYGVSVGEGVSSCTVCMYE